MDLFVKPAESPPTGYKKECRLYIVSDTELQRDRS